jgi:hypothetical protein
MSYSMIDNSAVWKARAVRFPLLDTRRARRAAHSANIGFSKSDYSPVLHRQKSPAQGFYKMNYESQIQYSAAIWRTAVQLFYTVY